MYLVIRSNSSLLARIALNLPDVTVACEMDGSLPFPGEPLDSGLFLGYKPAHAFFGL